MIQARVLVIGAILCVGCTVPSDQHQSLDEVHNQLKKLSASVIQLHRKQHDLRSIDSVSDLIRIAIANECAESTDMDLEKDYWGNVYRWVVLPSGDRLTVFICSDGPPRTEGIQSSKAPFVRIQLLEGSEARVEFYDLK